LPQKGGIANETVHLSFAADWSKEVNPLLADHQRRLFYFRGQETGVDHASFHGRGRRFRKKRRVAASNDDLRQPPKTAISRKPISIKDVAFRTRFGLRPEKTENQGPNRERKAGGWGESMVRRGDLERCETGANPLETRGKRKPVTPENDPRETGLSFLNGGGHGALPQFVLQTKPHQQTLFNQHFTTHQIPSVCRTPREI
jgi:hypothetical protein